MLTDKDLSDSTRAAQPVRNQVDLLDPYDVRHWTEVFGITELDLVIAVQNAGPMVKDVVLCPTVDRDTLQACRSAVGSRGWIGHQEAVGGRGMAGVLHPRGSTWFRSS